METVSGLAPLLLVLPEAYVTACKPDFGYRIRGEIPDLFENEYK